MHAKQGLTHASYRDFARKLERERDVLARWKKEALAYMRKWGAVDEAVREHPDTLVGHNITDTALRFIRERDEAIRDLESGFMAGTYARLKQLQDKERECHELRGQLRGFCKNIATALAYPRGSEAQVRCLEEIGGDATYILKTLKP